MGKAIILDVQNNIQVPDGIIIDTVQEYSNKEYIPFGKNNLFPQEIAKLNRESATHRAIINSKVIFIEGKKFLSETNEDLVKELKLRSIYHNLLLDFFSSGNGYLELVTDSKGNWFKLFHHDYTKCRVSKDQAAILIHPQWENFNRMKDKLQSIPIFPKFKKGDDGAMHSMIHIKDYEPEFANYGLPSWFAALNSAVINRGTDKWNKNRIDNKFAIDGLLIVPGITDVDQAKKLNQKFEQYRGVDGEKSGGMIPHYMKPAGVGESIDKPAFINFNENVEGSWLQLHSQSDESLIKIHNWYKSLAAFSEATGFDTKRIINDWNMAMSTIISLTQEKFVSLFNEIFEYFGEVGDLSILNVPPVSEISTVKFIWEVRRDQGLDYDETDPRQQQFYAQIGGQV